MGEEINFKTLNSLPNRKLVNAFLATNTMKALPNITGSFRPLSQTSNMKLKDSQSFSCKDSEFSKTSQFRPSILKNQRSVKDLQSGGSLPKAKNVSFMLNRLNKNVSFESENPLAERQFNTINSINFQFTPNKSKSGELSSNNNDEPSNINESESQVSNERCGPVFEMMHARSNSILDDQPNLSYWSRYKNTINELFDSLTYGFTLSIVTFITLFISDFDLAFLNLSSYYWIESVKVVCFLLLLLDFIFSCSAKEHYVLSIIFWLDLVSLLLFLQEIDLIFLVILSIFMNINSGFSKNNYGVAVNTITYAVSKTKISRLIKLIILFRLVRLIKLYKSAVITKQKLTEHSKRALDINRKKTLAKKKSSSNLRDKKLHKSRALRLNFSRASSVQEKETSDTVSNGIITTSNPLINLCSSHDAFNVITYPSFNSGKFSEVSYVSQLDFYLLNFKEQQKSLLKRVKQYDSQLLENDLLEKLTTNSSKNSKLKRLADSSLLNRMFTDSTIKNIMYISILTMIVIPALDTDFYYHDTQPYHIINNLVSEYYHSEEFFNTTPIEVPNYYFDTTNHSLIDQINSSSRDYLNNLSKYNINYNKLLLDCNDTSTANISVSMKLLIQYVTIQQINDDQPIINITYKGHLIFANSTFDSTTLRPIDLVEIDDSQVKILTLMSVYSNIAGTLRLFNNLYTCLLILVIYYFQNRDAKILILNPIEILLEIVNIAAKDPVNCRNLKIFKYGIKALAFSEERKTNLGASQDLEYTSYRNSWNDQKKNPSKSKRRSNILKYSNNEITIVQHALVKLSALLAIGIGEAGADIIRDNISRGNEYFLTKRKGKKIFGFFMFAQVMDFDKINLKLQKDSLEYINIYASIVQNCVDKFMGATNKNLGDVFLCCWKLQGLMFDEDVDVIDLHNMADCTVLCALDIIKKVRRSKELEKFLEAKSERPKIRFGIHAGWAIEGSIGSAYKIDVSYLSPIVNISSRLESASSQYGVDILISNVVYELLSHSMQCCLRKIDVVSVKGSRKRIELFTIDLNKGELKPNIKKKVKYNHLAKKEEIKAIIKDKKLLSSVYLQKPSFRNLLNSDKGQDFNDIFEESVELYLKGDWISSIEMLEKCNSIDPGDSPTQNLIKFLKELNCRPPINWNGIRDLTSK